MFQWIEPKICVNNVKDSTSLPESGKEEECAPCNPGMFKNGTRCDFCPPMTYSDGKATGRKLVLLSSHLTDSCELTRMEKREFA